MTLIFMIFMISENETQHYKEYLHYEAHTIVTLVPDKAEHRNVEIQRALHP